MTSYLTRSDEATMLLGQMFSGRLAEAFAEADGHAFHRALATLVTTVMEHDTYTGGHSCRVGDYCAGIAGLLSLSRPDVAFMRQAGLVHDIGKIGVPDRVLRKKGRLTIEELHLIRLHPIFGASLLSRMHGMKRMVPVVLHHHERWDGTGYPSGLSGIDIPVESRIILVADAFDAMTTARPYGEVLTTEEGLTELRRCAGDQFDPMVVDTMHVAWRNGLLDESARGPSTVLADAIRV